MAISFTEFGSVTGVFHSLYFTKAEVHDINFLKNIKQQMTDCVLFEDRGYLSESIQLDLFQTVNIKLDSSLKGEQANQKPKRTNQKDYKHNLIFLENQELRSTSRKPKFK